MSVSLRWVAMTLCVLVSGIFMAACTDQEQAGSTSTERQVKVSGQPGSMPKVDFTTPLDVSATSIERLVKGQGGPVVAGQPVVLNVTLIDGRTGKLALSTYAQDQQAMATTPTSESLFPVVQRALQTAVGGDRILIQAHANDAFGDAGAPQYDVRPGDPLLMVVDVMGVPPTETVDRATGVVIPAGKRVPKVVEREGLPTKVEFGSRPFKAKKLLVIPLIKGTGPPVSSGRIISINYLQQPWGADKPTTNTFTQVPQTFVFDTAGLLQTWQSGLDQVTRGSRVLIVAPAGMAAAELSGVRPHTPVAYVVDVLGVG